MRIHRLWHSVAWFGFMASCLFCGGPAIDAGAATIAEFADPEPFASQAGKFRFQFPGDPAESDMKAGDMTIHTTTYVDANRTEYAVLYSDLGPAIVKGKDPYLLLEGGVQGMIKSGGWTILSKKAIKLGEYSGLDVTGDVKTPNGAGLGQIRMYLVGDRLYQIIIVGTKSKVRLSEFQKHFDSFELIRGAPALARANARRATAPAAPAAPRAGRARQQMLKNNVQSRRSPAPKSAPGDEPAAETATDVDPGPDPSKPAEVAISLNSASSRMVDIPSGVDRRRSRDREEFRETAPKGGLLVGVRVGYVNGTRVASIQPIFQVDRSYVEGASQGASVAGEATVVAKPGYAVGGVNTRTGLLLDAFQLVFMKYEKGRLNPKDSYTSDWLGNPRGGNLKNVSGNGKIVAGVFGTTNKREINSLGLVVAE
jgi:hypothetical protein